MTFNGCQAPPGDLACSRFLVQYAYEFAVCRLARALTGPPGSMLCQVTLGPVPLLRFRADPKQGDPDERYFQYVQGLMNITSPRAAGGWGGSTL